MIVLGIDTATPVASVALAAGERVLARAEAVTTFSERLLPMIDALFAEAGLRPRDLAGVACGAGPGSFTGLRMGLAAAKGLCLATGARLLLVPTLEALAADAPTGAVVLSAVDAYRGEVYAGLFDVDAQGPRPRSAALAAFAARPDALAAVLDGARPTLYAGDGFKKYPQAIPAGARPIDDGGRPLAQAVLRLGRARLEAGQHDDPRRAAPLYVRPPAPEEKKAKP